MDGSLQIVLLAAAQQAGRLEFEAKNPFAILSAQTSAKAATGWAQNQRAQAELIRAAIADLEENR